MTSTESVVPSAQRCIVSVKGGIGVTFAGISLMRSGEASKSWCRSFGFHTSLKSGVIPYNAACGWALLQLDVDGCDIPWYFMYGTILANIDAERVLERG